MTVDAIDAASLRGDGGYSAVLPRWRFVGTAEIRKGLGIFDATTSCIRDPAPCLTVAEPDPSVPTANQRAVLIRLAGEGVWRPLPNIAFSLAPQAQYSHSALLNFERFSGGNYTVGRGYDPGTVIGDSGVGFSAEVRYGTLAPRDQNAFAFQPYAFVDAAWVWDQVDGVRKFDPQRLVSTGGGVRATWGDHARLDATVAVPLERPFPDTRRGDVRFLMTLTTRLLPWRS